MQASERRTAPLDRYTSLGLNSSLTCMRLRMRFALTGNLTGRPSRNELGALQKIELYPQLEFYTLCAFNE